MKKFYLIFLFIFLSSLTADSFEDCIISTQGKMTDIKIENHQIIDVYPLITLMNDKNTLIVHPLTIGNTRFSILKNNKDKYVFNVKVTEQNTIVDDVVGFEIQTLDNPPESSDNKLEPPPSLRGGEQ